MNLLETCDVDQNDSEARKEDLCYSKKTHLALKVYAFHGGLVKLGNTVAKH